MIPLLTDTLTHVARRSDDIPMGVYISLASLALAVAGIIWKGGVTIGEMRATRREHHKRIGDLEEGAKAAAESRITRQEMDARFAELLARLASLNDRVADLVALIKEARQL